ncbi:MAG TPA: glycoside hydrolase family 25 protein [Solirubrobacteraceae bacterium]|jgi:lysozyme|nr:glycoside hydrolase family 25 protein [Solirubrobacteraceae bacterium]
MARALRLHDTGAPVRDLQRALNARAEARFYPQLAVDGELGPATWRAFDALGFALGFLEATLSAPEISLGAQRLIADPSRRDEHQLARARDRAPKLHLRTIALDGTPTYWGLAKPLVRAREQGWSGRLASSDRRKGVAERFGKKSQATLYRCFLVRQRLGRCPASCGGDCVAANPPGQSSHEQRSDGAGFEGPVGRRLRWWELGLDLADSQGALDALQRLGYGVRRPYSSASELHHLNFTASPGPVLPGVGPNSHPPETPQTPKVPRPSGGSFTGPDVSLNQPDVDWRMVRRAGHEFAFAKVSDGLGTPDPAFGRARWKAMKDAGLIRGAYHFGRPQRGRDPRDEVHEFLRLLRAAGGLQPGDLRPVLDLEKFGRAGRLTPRQTLEWTRGWVAEMRAQIGRRPIIYTGVFWRETLGNPPDHLDCPLWLAAYVPPGRLPALVPRAWSDEGWTFWQHTESGTCPGIPGPCDLNRFRGSRGDLRRLLLT